MAQIVGGPIPVQVLVRNTTDVRISNLLIDASGAGSACIGGLSGAAAVEFYNVGQTAQVATASNLFIRSSCYYGILSNTSNAALESNDVGGGVAEAISVIGGTTRITSNNLAGGYGVHLFSYDPFTPSNSTVEGNTVAGTVFLDSNSGATVANNVISAGGISLIESSNNNILNNNLSGEGIGLFSDPGSGTGTAFNKILGNQIRDVSVGAGAGWFSSSSNVFQNNLFMNVQNGIEMNDYDVGAGANTVTNNTVNGATCGVVIYALNGTVYSPNNIVNTKTTICDNRNK